MKIFHYGENEREREWGREWGRDEPQLCQSQRWVLQRWLHSWTCSFDRWSIQSSYPEEKGWIYSRNTSVILILRELKTRRFPLEHTSTILLYSTIRFTQCSKFSQSFTSSVRFVYHLVFIGIILLQVDVSPSSDQSHRSREREWNEGTFLSFPSRFRILSPSKSLLQTMGVTGVVYYSSYLIAFLPLLLLNSAIIFIPINIVSGVSLSFVLPSIKLSTGRLMGSSHCWAHNLRYSSHLLRFSPEYSSHEEKLIHLHRPWVSSLSSPFPFLLSCCHCHLRSPWRLLLQYSVLLSWSVCLLLLILISSLSSLRSIFGALWFPTAWQYYLNSLSHAAMIGGWEWRNQADFLSPLRIILFCSSHWDGFSSNVRSDGSRNALSRWIHHSCCILVSHLIELERWKGVFSQVSVHSLAWSRWTLSWMDVSLQSSLLALQTSSAHSQSRREFISFFWSNE